MRIGITGGCGYIAQAIIDRLLERGEEVVVLDYNPANLREHENYTFIEGSIGCTRVVRGFLKGVDVVIHLAASKDATESNDPIMMYGYQDNNMIASMELLECMDEMGVKKIVFSSSAAVYGNSMAFPICEQAYSRASKPTTFYGYTKKVIEDHISWHSKINGLKYFSLRYFNAAGYTATQNPELEPESLIPKAVKMVLNGKPIQIYGVNYPTKDGTCIRDFIHVEDLAEAHISAVDRLMGGVSNFTVNIGSGTGYSVREVVTEIASQHPVVINDAPARTGDVIYSVANISRAKTVLGWKPMRPLRDMIGSTFEKMSSGNKYDEPYKSEWGK